MNKNFLSMTILCIVAMTTVVSCKKDSPAPPAPITADFTYLGAGLAPASVKFTNASINATSYLWDFGDNTISTLESPQHVYTKGGVFTVRLSANGAAGPSVITKTVNIQSPTSVKITSVKLLGMSFTDPASGSGWDISTGPDVYFTLSDNSDNVLITATPANDILFSSLPLLWTLTPAYQITNLAGTYKIRLYDKDSPDADDFIEGISFPLSSIVNAGYPSTQVLQVTGSTLKVELGLQWQ